MRAVDVITRSLRGVGYIGTGQTPDSDALNDGFLMLNEMLDSWGLSKLFVFQYLEEQFPLTAGKGVYTMGPGGDFSTVRPNEIVSAYVRLGQIDYPIQIIDNDAYSNIGLKASFTSITQFLYLDPKQPLAEVNLWPVPQAGLTLFMQSAQQLAQFPDLATDVTFPPGYGEAIRHGLMPRLAAEGLGTITGEQAEIAKASIARLKTLNSNVPVLKPDYATNGAGRFNIYRGY